MTLTQYLRTVLAREQATTKGPWYYCGSLTEYETGTQGGQEADVRRETEEPAEGEETPTESLFDERRDEDCDFIAHARDDVPALVKMLEVAVAALARQKTVLEKQQCDCCIGNEAGHVVRCSRCWSLDDIDSALVKLQAMVPGEGR